MLFGCVCVCSLVVVCAVVVVCGRLVVFVGCVSFSWFVCSVSVCLVVFIRVFGLVLLLVFCYCRGVVWCCWRVCVVGCVA